MSSILTDRYCKIFSQLTDECCHIYRDVSKLCNKILSNNYQVWEKTAATLVKSKHITTSFFSLNLM